MKLPPPSPACLAQTLYVSADLRTSSGDEDLGPFLNRGRFVGRDPAAQSALAAFRSRAEDGALPTQLRASLRTGTYRHRLSESPLIQCSPPVFLDDGVTACFRYKERNHYFVRTGDDTHGPYDDCDVPKVSSDGKGFVWKASHNGTHHVFFDGLASSSYLRPAYLQVPHAGTPWYRAYVNEGIVLGVGTRVFGPFNPLARRDDVDVEFSSDGTHWVVQGPQAEGFCGYGDDGTKYGPFDEPAHVNFSDDGKLKTICGVRDDAPVVYINDRLAPDYIKAKPSPDGSRVAGLVRTNDGIQLKVGDELVRIEGRVDAVVFSPDGVHWAARVHGRSRSTILKDGKAIAGANFCGVPAVANNGDVLFVKETNKGRDLVRNNIGVYSGVERHAEVLVSPDGRHWILRGGRQIVVDGVAHDAGHLPKIGFAAGSRPYSTIPDGLWFDGQRFTGYTGSSSFMDSADGARCFARAQCEGGGEVLIIDGRETEEYGRFGKPALFGDNGFAVAARRGRDHFLVTNRGAMGPFSYLSSRITLGDGWWVAGAVKNGIPIRLTGFFDATAKT